MKLNTKLRKTILIQLYAHRQNKHKYKLKIDLMKI